ncbi:MAG TPA: SMC-Scp complex subunit ScpB [Myxococcota bacterium]|nr:SMC-Scp complex subunit ScpB [Myxococcota bacterium]
MEQTELTDALEAVLFAASEPLSFNDLKRIFTRFWASRPEEDREALLKTLRPAFNDLKERWSGAAETRGFALMEVAEGTTFRSSPRFADVLRAMREERPLRLSKPAMETLAIIAYRQPVTKPEVDDIRGVDCGGTIKLLLERNMLRIVGKKEEPGRPLLYGTTKDFLSFFNLPTLGQLPSLREFSALTEDSEEELRAFDGLPSLKELSESAKQLRLQEEPAVTALEEAVGNLAATETQARDAFASQGIALVDEEEPQEPAPSSPEQPSA